MSLEQEATRICSELIRIDTTNPGDGSGPGERAAAEYVATELDACGIEATVLETAPRRSNVVARIAGADPNRPPLLVHGHLDVVPADPGAWSVPPDSGAVHDGCVWGRGALDMKSMLAMMLAVVGDWHRTGHRPARDLVFAFIADEEHTGEYGSRYLVRKHADLFDACREGITEYGGFRYPLENGVDIYPIGTGERGLAWLELTARGTAGHASQAHADNAVATLARALVRLSDHRFPVSLTATTRTMIDRIAVAVGADDGGDPETVVAKLGRAAALIEPVLRNSVTPTVVRAGSKVNVIPGEATAEVDVRLLPGARDQVLRVLAKLLGDDVAIKVTNSEAALESDPASTIYAAMSAALTAEDPAAIPVPLLVTGATDAKSFAKLGTAGYGFTPWRGPDDFDGLSLIHGVDERIPLDALAFGVRVLRRFLTAY